LVRAFINRLIPLFIGLIVLKLVLLRGFASLAYRSELLHMGAAVTSGCNIARELVRAFQIEYMTIGGAAAYLLFKEKIKPGNWLLHPLLQVLNCLLLVMLIWYNDFEGHDFVQATVFALFILHVVSNSRLWPVIDSKPLQYLGIISYGIYMFHPTVIALLLDGLAAIPAVKSSFWLLNILLYGLTLIITIAVSALSYAFFETPFLRLKNRLEIIKTTGTPSLDSVPEETASATNPTR
jgi:peptidoglycan/LPS O-acetylase OafA/YrhL